jgi:hypothetical protein
LVTGVWAVSKTAVVNSAGKHGFSSDFIVFLIPGVIFLDGMVILFLDFEESSYCFP